MIVDDHSFFRHGLREVLTEHDFEVVAEANTGEQALEAIRGTAPAVVIMDLSMPGMGGIEATRRIAQEWPHIRVVVLSVTCQGHAVVDAITAGACGYLLKDDAPEQIASGVRAAFEGGSPVSPKTCTMLINRLREREQARGPDSPEASLTAREVEILRLLAHGKDNGEIAAEVFVSPSTVKNHISNVLKKLEVKNRIQAAVYATQAGIL